MKFIVGQKAEMTQQFAESGAVVPVTRVVAGPCVVTQVKAASKDGYCAIQLGFGQRRTISKPVRGHLKGLGSFRYLREFRVTPADAEKLHVGDTITVGVFTPGDVVKVTGTAKGKGFQGVVKRHGFHGSPATHGHKDQLRMPGSIGSTGPAHVFKGTRMGGQMGGGQSTITNLKIVAVNPSQQELLIKGAIPGPRGGLVLVAGNGELTLAAAPTEVVTAAPTDAGTEPAPAPVSEPQPEAEPKQEK